MAYTEVKTTGYGGRLKESCSGVAVGFLLFVAGTILIWWNEGRYVKTADMLEEAERVCVDVDNVTKYDSSLDGQLIHATAPVITSDTLSDSRFSEIRANALSIRRKVSYYQWVEESQTTTEEKIGGKKVETTTYTYHKEWTSSPVNSGNFHDPEYQNANSVKISNIDDDDIYATSATFGAYNFSETMIKMVGGQKPLDISVSDNILAEYSNQIVPGSGSTSDNLVETAPKEVLDSVRAANDSTISVQKVVRDVRHPYANVTGTGTIYFGESPNAPKIGDVMVEYTFVPSNQTVSILAKVNGQNLSSWKAKNNKQLLVVSNGTLTSEEMFQSERDANDLIKWLCRLGGLLLVIIGLKSMFSIVGAIFNFLPFLAGIVNFGVGAVCTIVGIVWSLLVFGIAWLFYRPIVGIIVIVIAVAIIVFFARRGMQKKALQAALAPAGSPSVTSPAAENPKRSVIDKANEIRQKIEKATGQPISIPGLPNPPQQPTPIQPQPQAPEVPEKPSGNLFCPKCGTRLPAESAFCPKCGAPQ